MSNVNDNQIVASNAVIDEVWIVSRRKHPNTGDVRHSAQARIFRQQSARGAYLSRDGGCPRAGYIAQCVGRFPQYHCGHSERTVASQATLLPERSHFLITYELTLLGLSETFKHGSAMILGYTKRVAPCSSNLLQHFRDISLPIFRKLADLFNGVFENLGH